MNIFLKSMIILASVTPALYAMEAPQNEKEQAAQAQYFFQMGEKILLKLNESNLTSPAANTAFEYYKKAADMNHPKAQFKAGVFYSKGVGVERDLGNAFEYFHKASADSNELGAHCELGSAYLNGHGTKKDITLGIISLLHAADRGHEGAQIELGIFHVEAMEAPYKDYKKALFYLEKPAQNGNPEALCALAHMYGLGGYGISKDEKQAFKYLLAAAQMGHVRAYFLVGNCYFVGKGVQCNSIEARRWFKMALKFEENPEAIEAANIGWAQLWAYEMIYKALQDDINPNAPSVEKFTCAACAKSLEKPNRCSRCKKAHYCNSECQNAHWLEHKKICVAVSK